VLPYTVTCHIVLDLPSLLRRASVLPRIPQLQTSSFCREGLRCCHVSSGIGPRLPIEEGSDAATCPVALDLVSPLRRAPVLSCVQRL
jgi:hypothetical protein